MLSHVENSIDFKTRSTNRQVKYSVNVQERRCFDLFLFHPRFVAPLPSALYHIDRNRGGISLVLPSLPTRVISSEMRVISSEMRVISWKPW